jgi:putative FmdB family regulatory protein
MPVYDYDCETHGLFQVNCRLADWNDFKPCPTCGKSSEQMLLPSRVAGHFSQPIIVHVAADGAVRFPGASDAKVPRGFEKRELRTIREAEQFERTFNQQLRVEADRHHMNEDRHFGEVRAQQRSELRMKMQQMSQQGQDFARAAMKANDQRRSKSNDCGFHIHIIHFDASNREKQRDASTGWKPKDA